MYIVRNIIFCFLLFNSISLYSAENAESFIITALSRHYKVISPVKKSKKFSVIIKNNTLSKIYSKVENENGKILKMINIVPGSFKSVDMDKKDGKDFYFFPISPPFQKIKLDFGKKSYEIPPQK